ncbi:hypothetical protein ABKV19_004068 [Rosa sericea]
MQRRVSIVSASVICYWFRVLLLFRIYYHLSHDREIKILGVFPAVLEKKGQEEKFNPKFGECCMRLITVPCESTVQSEPIFEPKGNETAHIKTCLR